MNGLSSLRIIKQAGLISARRRVRINFYRKFVFTVEGTATNYAFRDGHFVDVYLMARLREQKGSS